MPRKYQAFDPDSEVIGQSMLSMIECINQESIRPILEKRNLTDIQPDDWYPVQDWLDVLNDLTEDGDHMLDFVSVGMKAAEITPWPPELEQLPFDQAIAAINDAFIRQIHRGDVGDVQSELVDDTHLKITLRTPYPDDLMYGAAYQHARHFLPPSANFAVFYDEDEPRRDMGGEVTIVHIEW